jgi:hypothetical protein
MSLCSNLVTDVGYQVVAVKNYVKGENGYLAADPQQI